MDELLYTFDDYARLCEHEYTHVRRWAFDRIRAQYPDRAGSVLAGLVDDPDEELAVETLLFIQQQHASGAESKLIELIGSDRERVARESIDALGELRCAEAVPALTEILSVPPDDDTLTGAADALAKIGRTGHDALLGLLEQEDAGTFEHEVAFDALTHDPLLGHLPKLVEAHLAVSALDEGRSYVHHFASQAECHRLWMEIGRVAGPRVVNCIELVAEMLGETPDALASPEFVRAAEDLWWTDVPQVATAILDELTHQLASLHLPEALQADAPHWQRVAFCRATLIRELAPRLGEGDVRELEVRQADLSLVLACLLLLKHETVYADIPAEGRERVDALVRSLPDGEGPLIDEFLQEMAENAELYANRLCGLFDPEDDTPASRLIAEVIVRTPAEKREVWEPLVPELVQSCRAETDPYLTTAAASALRVLGPVALDDIATAFEADEDGCRYGLLSVLEEIPTQRSFELIRDHFAELTEAYDEYPLNVLASIGAPETIELLDAAPQPDEFGWLAAMVQVCDACGLERDDLEELRTRYVQELAEREEEDDEAALEPWDEAIATSGSGLDPHGPVEMRLTCQACEAERPYLTERVLLAAGHPDHPVQVYLTEELECKACKEVGRLTVSPAEAERLIQRLQMAFTEEGTRDHLRHLLQRVVPADPYEFEGEPMTPLEGLAQWRQRAEANPEDGETQTELAKTLRELWRLDEAERAAERALELKPEALQPRLVLAEVAELREETDLAKERYTELQKLARQSSEPGWSGIVRLTERRLEDREVAPDEVQEARARKEVGRNDPCPCGSGKKYKKCCLRKA